MKKMSADNFTYNTLATSIDFNMENMGHNENMNFLNKIEKAHE